MNQIICDICGSAYPEGYDRCPVCSYPRQGGEKVVAAGAVEAVPEKVKGGQFSKKNVKKRRKAQKKAALAAMPAEPLEGDEAVETEENEAAAEPRSSRPNRPLWITIIILLIAIVLVAAYIAMRFGQGLGMFLPEQTTTPATTAPAETTEPTVPCAGILLDTAVIALDEAGQQQSIGMKLIPGTTTDTVTFVSQDPAVVAVDETGLLSAVGSGQTTITITCGGITRELTVMCWFADETTAPAETTAPTEPPETTKATEATEATESAVLKLDPEDASCFTAGESFVLYARLGSSTVDRTKVTWSSSDPKVAKVENGTVTAMGKGTATITAEYNGMKAVCTVRCRFEGTAEPEKPKQEEQGGQENAAWKASHSDVSISVGESFRLKVTNSAGETADAIWTMDMDGIVSIDGKTITGQTPGTVTLTTTVDGVTMTCIVRVK